MFEAHVLHLLKRYLGEYVHGLSTEALRISVWKGDVVLKDLRLKAEALNLLKLPVTVKAGFVGTITLKVPWKSLGKEPVIVLIDRVFILGQAAPDAHTLKEDDKQMLFEAKLQQIEELELATLEAMYRSNSGSTSTSSWLGSLIATIIGNLKISITNVHFRYEDSMSNCGHPFSCGITLAKLAAVTVDEQGNETFDASGALDRLRKSVELQRLAVYHDSDSYPWTINKTWEDLSPGEWVEIFEDGINESSGNQGVLSKWARSRNFLISPINGTLKYHRLGKQERSDPDIPFEKASLTLSDVLLTISEAQYHDWIKLFEVFARYRTHIEISYLRPGVAVSQNPKLWWRYAAQAVLQQKRMCFRLSWDQIRDLCQLRRLYIQLYSASLQSFATDGMQKIREMEKDLDPKVILLWRLLAHAKVESVKTKEAAERQKLKNKSWFSFKWWADPEYASSVNSSGCSSMTVEKFTKDEWQVIHNLLSYQGEEELPLISGKDSHNMVKLFVTVSVEKAAARIIDRSNIEILCGTFQKLKFSTKFKSRSSQCDVLLKFYGLSSPEGSLAESVSNEQKVNALCASFVYSPTEENVDWKLSATISPCHVTVLPPSFDRLLDFVKRSNAVSPTVALETATVLQSKIEKVTRRAQEQFQIVLVERCRFALDIDFDAPKVRVPMTVGSSGNNMNFVLDFGHFTLNTMETNSDQQKQSIYSRFHITGRCISAFFMNCDSDIATESAELGDIAARSFSSILDRCGMTVMIDQIKAAHPSYPSTRISVQVPNLGIHFSPMRYLRLMELVNILYNTMDLYGTSSDENFCGLTTPWTTIDITSDARILVWKGIGYSVAAWQPCFLVLSGQYLYVMECQESPGYQRYLRMSGRQVVEVPASSVGGSQNCLAVCIRGMDIQQALESSSTWVLEFRVEDEKEKWLRGLVQATYQASAPPSIDILGDPLPVHGENTENHTAGTSKVDLIMTGTLVETKLYVYGKSPEDGDHLQEKMIIEVLAEGGKVHMMRSERDLMVKMKLHSFSVKDELLGHLSLGPCYLARSVIKNNKPLTLSSDFHAKNTSSMSQDDDDTFKDALPDFQLMSDCSMLYSECDISHHENLCNFVDESCETFEDCQDAVRVKQTGEETFYEVQNGEILDFVSVKFSTRSSSSVEYDGTDTKMIICMSKLEFYCNRPTIVALIKFGFDLGNSSVEKRSGEMPNDMICPIKEKADVSGPGRVNGVLGFGKSRSVFYLIMRVDNVTVFLNKEDGSQLAMIVQENFLLDLKVHPSSVSIEGLLGNCKLCDTSLGKDQTWCWLCDIRNPGTESLIKFTFCSYSKEDDDYEGYDYSLIGRLSAVRIVFLYRFIQEMTVYFMELADPHTEEAIKLVDKVGGFEWLIHKYEIDGATALKLDLSLDTPIIIVPKNSRSRDFIQLDLGQLQLMNEFSWFGDPASDPYAVHMDILHAEILGINMSVGVDGCLGKPMIRDGYGLDVHVRRSLRDVFRKVPLFCLEVKVGFLHGVMSDREYNVIIDCGYMNLHEEPLLPPSFRDANSGSNDTMRLLVDKVNLNSQVLLSQTATVVEVEIHNALLELCNGAHESPLAHLSLEGLWVSYRMNSISETDLYVTIPKFSVLDVRPDTRSEMRLMLGSLADASKPASSGALSTFMNQESFSFSIESNHEMEYPNPTMLLMDYRWRLSSQSCVFRVQQPRVLFVPDFLLTVGEFFFPAIRNMTGREESMDATKDPLNGTNTIVLSGPYYKQTEDVVYLSPSRQLVVDAIGCDEYVYDGCGKIISLKAVPSGSEHVYQYKPIVYIGHGKKLRFLNVKIENGFLLRDYVYLSNDSSYSVSVEDSVDISFSENFVHKINEISSEDIRFPENVGGSDGQTNSNLIQSFTFESQVVSAEFTFYDSTKFALDDSSYGEKLVRAKFDLSFMYASKDDDTWIRATAKDLTVEAGSGLIIINPIDISGGYSSVKEKTNMSLMLSDLCINLSLGSISLMLNLHNQVMTALQYGNALPLAPCTNFDRIWVSTEETGSQNNITFWRPQAPANYVILGDCVTSRASPPSQAVMAVRNTYGRVRKPVGFNLVGLVSSIQGLRAQCCPKADIDCSLWMPIPSPGYTALGCVTNIGNQPPPSHVVYCLRSDLVASAGFSECMLSVSPNSLYSSGFSIWRLDNAISSFCAYSSTKYPHKHIGYDLSHLLWNTCYVYESKQVAAGTSDENQLSDKIDENLSRWDLVRPVSKALNYSMSTPNFERLWWDKGNDIRVPISIWRPVAHPGYGIVGDCITEGLDPPALGLIFKAGDLKISSKPVQYTKVAQILGKANDDLFFWYPVAPPGYASLGCVVTKVDETPLLESFCCPRLDLVSQANIAEHPIAQSSSYRASPCWSIWKVENQACTFFARSDHNKPTSRLALTIGDFPKPKSRENITSDVKLRFCSITVLDSLCGKMTPLFDATITNIKLSTHGRFDVMNAVLVSSFAASSFNTRLEAWEPFVEPFDWIFKMETYSTNARPSRFTKRLHFTATSIVNINFSAANLDTFVGTLLGWWKQLELDKKASKLTEESYGYIEDYNDPSHSALDEDDFQSVCIENQLGSDLQLKWTSDCLGGSFEVLQHGGSISIWVPPPRFSDRLKIADDSRDARYYVAIQIVEAKGLSVVDDGNNHKIFCALRLVDSQTTDQQKIFTPSARTKCVKPTYSPSKELSDICVRWNELFILEIPQKSAAKLEFEVTNLAAKAGKGEVVGSLSLPIGHHVTFKKMASGRILYHPHDLNNIFACPLLKKHGKVDDKTEHAGSLLLSITYLERKVASKVHDAESRESLENDIGFWIRLGSDDAWASVRSLLPVSVVPKAMQNGFIAMDVVMKEGKKYATFRGLATIENDLDVKLELCIVPAAHLHPVPSVRKGTLNSAIDEIFENQRFSAWGSNWSGLKDQDPGRWSTRDFSFSSKEFFEPPLPSGWQWTSSWIIDKAERVDGDGWAYGSDFYSLTWPPSQMQAKSSQDMVRRRRWIRQRQEVCGTINRLTNGNMFDIKPGFSYVLPWESLSKDSDNFLLVRPCDESPDTEYTWGQEVAVGKIQPFTDQSLLARQNTVNRGSNILDSLKLSQLERKDVLLCCFRGNQGRKFWISLGIDASVLHTELNTPVYDWKICVNSPIKLENHLPCTVEFTIWERSKEDSCIERQNGIISPRKDANIYAADINKPIYLTLIVQGGWFPEKDRVLVLDHSSSEHVSFCWLVHHQSKRRLRVSIERDVGGTAAAQNIIRFFVPYWIVNESSLPMIYRLVEIEQSVSEDTESVLLSRVKSAKAVLKVPTMEKRRSGVKRNIEVLEVIEDTSPLPSMFSLYLSPVRSGAIYFSSQKDSYLKPHVGLAVALAGSDMYNQGIPLVELEKKERVSIKAFGPDRSYYSLSAVLKTSERTKVVHFQPHTLFINRVGLSICLRQSDSENLAWIHPNDPPRPFKWHISSRVEHLMVMVDGYDWSIPFSVSNEGRMQTTLKKVGRDDQMQLWIQVRTGTKYSHYEVIFRPSSSSSSYRIENRSIFLTIRYRQVDGANNAWFLLSPNSAASFLWEDLGRRMLLELSIVGKDISQSFMCNLEEVGDDQRVCLGSQALCVTILKEDQAKIVKIRDWIPENGSIIPLGAKATSLLQGQTVKDETSEFHLVLELSELGLSIIDHTPEEILYVSVQNLLFSYSAGLGCGLNRFKLKVDEIQIDNQLPLTSMPVLFRPQKFGESDCMLRLSVTFQSNGSIDFLVYPYIGFSGPDSSAFVVNIHEPIIWRLHEMIGRINFSRVLGAETTAVPVDPIVQIGVLNISEVRFRVSMAMSPGQRPKGVLGFWSSLMSALGNTENMPVRINNKFQESICMRQSTMITIAISNVKKDLLGQPLQLLSGVDILGNASSALGHMSKGVAALSMDKKFIQSRQRQESKGIEDLGDVIREGGGALAKGLFRGVTGILTKPLEGAKSSGVEGFVQGVGKGIIGAAAQPVSGVLDLLSKTTEGANAMRMKIQSAITSEEQLLRRRLPRVIGGDNLLRPYNDYKAQGQVILQLAESGSFLGHVDLFKVRGKFALSDAYEDHFMLPKGKILVVSHRRVMLLQQPLNILAQRKFTPARDPCSVLWDVLWDNLATMELTHGKDDADNTPPSRLLLYLCSKPVEVKEPVRVIKCYLNTDQALKVYMSIEKAKSIYNTGNSKDVRRSMVTRPYAPSTESNNFEVNARGNIWSSQQFPGTVPSTFGNTSN